MSFLKGRNFSILLSGQVVSTLGNNLYGIALPWYVYTLTNSKSALALTGLAQTLPAVVGLFSGVMVDRWHKRTTMIGSDFIRAAFCFVLLLCVMSHSSLWAILVFVLALEVVGQFFNPASGALFPMLVRNDEMAGAQGIMQSSTATAKLIGTVSGGALMAALGAPLLFLLNGVSFILSCVSLLLIRVSEPPRRRAKVPEGRENTFYREWLEGVALIVKSRYFLLVMIAALVTNFALAPFEIGVTAWVKGPMHSNVFALGIINAGFFVGMIAGGLLLGKIAKKIPQRGIIAAGLMSTGVFSGCFGLFYTVWAEMILCIAIGFAVGCLNGSLGATFVALIPEQLRGRVFGLTGALGMIAVPVGMAVFGVLMVHLPLTLLFVFIGAVCILSGSSLMLPIRDDRERLLTVDPVIDSGQSV